MKTSEIGKNAAALSLIEVGLGSLLHGLKLPFSGHVLSLNQSFILTRATLRSAERRDAPVISTTAAILKSLSPAGKKLTPMLAIAVQGQLYYLGLLVAGPGVAGQLLGSLLLSLWGFLQPLAVYYVLYGETLVTVVEQLTKDSNGLWWLTGVVVAVKLFLSLGVVVLAHRLSEQRFERLVEWARSQKAARPQASAPSALTGAVKDLGSPLFVVSWLVTAGFYFYAQSAIAPTVWVLIRPVALGFILFYLARRTSPDWVRRKLERRFPVLAQTLSEALRALGRD